MIYSDPWRLITSVLIFILSIVELVAVEPNSLNEGFEMKTSEWLWWRGPARNGEADANQKPPTRWSEDTNIVWKAKIAGRGYGSPIVVGEKVILQTADEVTDSQSVLCFERGSGKLIWNSIIHKSGGMRKNKKSTAASSTPACDGERVFVNYANSDAVVATALDLMGNTIWQQEVSKYVIHQGYGSSPALYQTLVIVSADSKGGGAIAAMDRKSGKIVWRRDRPEKPNYSSPVILHVAGRDQLVITGCDQIISYDPLTGATIWESEGATTECVTSTVTDGNRIFTSGGYPKNHVSAVRADGSGKVDWENQDRLYVPSLVCREGYLYAVLDAGIAVCWKSETGEEMWKSRLGGTFSSSPVLVGDKIYATSESGETFIFRADSTKHEELGKNLLGDEVLSTPVFVSNQIFYRASELIEGQRQEFLYCIGRLSE